MTLGLAFWILMLLWLAFGLWAAYPWPAGNHVLLGGNLMLFLLLLLLGWQTFGSPLHK